MLILREAFCNLNSIIYLVCMYICVLYIWVYVYIRIYFYKGKFRLKQSYKITCFVVLSYFFGIYIFLIVSI